MIKSLLAFMSGSVYKTGHTNKKILLSDNTSWNSTLFHQGYNLLKALTYCETAKDEYINILNKKICEVRLRREEILLELANSNLFVDSEIIMPWGKYKGISMKEIHKTDPQYLDWLWNIASVDKEKTLSQNQVKVSYEAVCLWLEENKQKAETKTIIENLKIENDSLPF